MKLAPVRGTKIMEEGSKPVHENHSELRAPELSKTFTIQRHEREKLICFDMKELPKFITKRHLSITQKK